MGQGQEPCMGQGQGQQQRQLARWEVKDRLRRWEETAGTRDGVGTYRLEAILKSEVSEKRVGRRAMTSRDSMNPAERSMWPTCQRISKRVLWSTSLAPMALQLPKSCRLTPELKVLNVHLMHGKVRDGCRGLGELLS